jgi:primary-amine oxidase
LELTACTGNGLEFDAS